MCSCVDYATQDWSRAGYNECGAAGVGVQQQWNYWLWHNLHKSFVFCTEASCLLICWLVLLFLLTWRENSSYSRAPKIWTVWPMSLNKTFGEAPGSSLRPTSNFSMNYKTDVFENDLVLSLYFFPTLCKDHEMKEICVVVGAKECMVSPESFSFTDKHTAASVNKIHGERVRHIW